MTLCCRHIYGLEKKTLPCTRQANCKFRICECPEIVALIAMKCHGSWYGKSPKLHSGAQMETARKSTQAHSQEHTPLNAHAGAS